MSTAARASWPRLALALAACALSVAPAAAQEPLSVAVLPTEIQNPDHADLGERLRSKLKLAIAEAPEFFESDRLAMSVGEAKLGFACFEETAECLAQMGDGIALDRMVWARLLREEGAWDLRVRMLDFGSRTFIVDRSWTLPGGADRIEELELLAAGAIRGDAPEAKPTARLIVDSDPPGADITLDGRMLGTTPITQQVTRGRHLVEVSLPGRRTVRKEIDVGPGEHRELIKLPIVPKEVPAAAAPVETVGPGWAFWAGLGAGAVAVGAGVVATVAYAEGQDAVDEGQAIADLGQERADADTARFDQLTDEHRAARNLHLATTIVAGVAGAAAIYLLFVHEDPAAPVITPAVGADSAGAFITGSF